MQTGDTIPATLGTDQDGREVTLADLGGRKLILYFYPKDNTSGCTAEACSLRDSYDALRAAGYEVVGVSTDGAASHRRFIEKNALPFRLVADVEKALVRAFGVWGEKKMCGRTYMGTLRTTFVIGADGRVEHVLGPKQVKTKTHGEQLLALISENE